jgi:Spy/CpxP family protein refolding chaperone
MKKKVKMTKEARIKELEKSADKLKEIRKKEREIKALEDKLRAKKEELNSLLLVRKSRKSKAEAVAKMEDKKNKVG